MYLEVPRVRDKGFLLPICIKWHGRKALKEPVQVAGKRETMAFGRASLLTEKPRRKKPEE